MKKIKKEELRKQVEQDFAECETENMEPISMGSWTSKTTRVELLKKEDPILYKQDIDAWVNNTLEDLFPDGWTESGEYYVSLSDVT